MRINVDGRPWVAAEGLAEPDAAAPVKRMAPPGLGDVPTVGGAHRLAEPATAPQIAGVERPPAAIGNRTAGLGNAASSLNRTPSGLGSTTLHQVLGMLRADLLSRARYMTCVSLDGRLADGDDLSALRDRPLSTWRTIDISSRPLSDVLNKPLSQTAGIVKASVESLQVAAADLADGQEARACEKVISVTGVLPMIIEHLERLMAALTAVGWPLAECRDLPILRERLAGHVADLHNAIASRDFGALAQIIRGPMAQTHRRTIRALTYLSRRLDRPRRLALA